MFVRPCCASNQLPRGIMEAPNRVLTFHTHGDVDFEKFYKSLANFVADPAVMVLTLPFVSISVANVLLQCFERGWITDLILTTFRDDSKLISSTLKAYLPHVSYATDRIDYYSSQMTLFTSAMFCDSNDASTFDAHDRRQALILAGPLFATIKEPGTVCTYTATFVSSLSDHVKTENGDHLINATLPAVMAHRSPVHRVIKANSPVIGKFLASIHFSDKI